MIHNKICTFGTWFQQTDLKALCMTHFINRKEMHLVASNWPYEKSGIVFNNFKNGKKYVWEDREERAAIGLTTASSTLAEP